MDLSSTWYNDLINQVPTDVMRADTLIDYTGAPAAGLDPSKNRVVVGLVEQAWSNPLFYPEGGFPAGLKESPDVYLPSSKGESLLSAFNSARHLHGDARLFAYVLVANEDGKQISGSRNHWQEFSRLTMAQVLGQAPVQYYDEAGNLRNYNQNLLPKELSKAVGIDEFTLDILAVRTFNQYADIAVFIVPDDTLYPNQGVPVDLTQYRLAPLPADAANLPLVVSSSHGGGSSLHVSSEDNAETLWPDPPKLPASYGAQDNTGVLLTLSAGDQVAGIDLLDDGQQQPLTFNTWPSSSPLFLTVGGVAYETQGKDTITGAVAWRHPSSSDKPAASMEGGNGGFSPAAAMPAYQQVSPWIQQFQRTALASSLNDAWTDPESNTSFAWWTAGGQALNLGKRPKAYTFLSAEASASAPLAVNPTLARQMPDLANLAWQDDFLSLTLAADTSLKDPNWAKQITWHLDGGTSLAAPATAALLAAVNLERRRRGLADLSATEAHVLLYQLPPNLLTDITALQNPPPNQTTAYRAYPGYDYASGLGAFGGSTASQLLDSLGRTTMSLLPERPEHLPDVIVKPGGLPLVLAKQQGASSQLRLVRMNGQGVNALLLAAQQNPEVLRTGLLRVLEDAANANRGQANAVVFDVRTLEASWQAASPHSVLNLPLHDFASSEGVAVTPGSLIDLAQLPDTMPAAGGQSPGMPAFYALLSQTALGGIENSLEFRPFQRNQGGLLRQGAWLQPADRSSSAALVATTLQWPLLQAHVAAATGAPASDTPQPQVELVLRSVASFANLYGLYPVDGPDGAVLDNKGARVLPGDPGYASLALKAAFGNGRQSFLWSAPDHGTRRFSHLQDWSQPAAPSEGEELAAVLKPGGLYQHFILSSPTPQARDQVVASLLQGNDPSPAVLARLSFALAAGNADGQSHGHGLGRATENELLSLGFEDLPGLGDRDYNDVIASWTLQDGVFGIGSTCLVDLTADRIPDLAAGSQAGSPSTVVVVASNSGETLQQWQPFGAEDWSGVQVGAGDVNGDGFDDLVAVRATVPEQAGPSGGCSVQVLLGGAAPLPNTPSTLSFNAFGGSMAGPLSLAVRDLDLDGFAEVVLTATKADPQRSSLALEVWSAAGGSFQQNTSLNLPATTGLDPRHGYSVALGDLEGDGPVELVLGDLQGANLLVGTIPFNGAAAAPGTVVQPYGSNSQQGVRPTVVSAQQTLIQRPQGLAAEALPWAVGATVGPQNALLAGLGTPGALVVQTANPLDPQPAQVPASWFTAADDEPLLAMAWDSREGAPVFSSGGVSYLAPSTTEAKPALLSGAPQPQLVSAAAGSTTLELLRGPAAGQSSGSWQPMAGSSNTISTNRQATTAGWANPWGANSGDNATNSSLAREQFNQVSTALTSYTPPFTVNLNPLGLATPQELIADLAAHNPGQITQVVQPWNSSAFSQASPSAWGPGVPGSNNDPYPSTQLPSFQPSFRPLPPANTSSALVSQFQQRLISMAMTSLGINYQHHHSPLWYSSASWTEQLTPTPQASYLTTPEGRQTQGLDCSNFSSWNYNNAFGFWLNSSVSDQATQTSATVDWLTGENKTITSQQIAQSPKDVYLVDPTDPNSTIRSKDEVITYLNTILQPGDLLYIAGDPTINNPSATDVPAVTHVITWLNNNSATDPLHFVSLDKTGSTPPNPAFVIDSTGSESTNFLGQAYPNGVQIRQFNETAWYVTNIVSINRWLTPDNVQLLANALPPLG